MIVVGVIGVSIIVCGRPGGSVGGDGGEWPVAAKGVEASVGLPDPGDAGSLDQVVERLRSLKIWAGNPSFDGITARVNAKWTAAGRPPSELARRGTVVDCFR